MAGAGYDEIDDLDDGDVSPRIGLPRNGPLEDLRSFKSERKDSRSILCVENDTLDSDGFIEQESNDETKVNEFFQYAMNHKDRGVFVIFNHKKFTIKSAKERTGTDKDRENLFETARGLGFTVFNHDNLTKDRLMKEIKHYAEIDYSDCDCFACAILTHGEAGDVLYAKDGKYSIRDVLSPFRNCPTLMRKPKLFFVQACRGKALDHGVTASETDSTDAGGFLEATEDDEHSIPVEADYFIGYSTVEGYYAWRNGENGSWFIQALCYCLQKYGTEMELMQIMTRVNRMVAYDFESNVSNPYYNKKKQMPSLVTRLTGDVYFGPHHRDTSLPDVTSVKASMTMKSLTSSLDKQNIFMKTQLLRTKLELAKLRREKSEVEKKEQDLVERIIEYKIAGLR